MFRILLIIHKYLGIGLGVLVFLWCLSGFVMMYVQYPQLSDEEYRNGLQIIDVQQCCKLGNAALERFSGVESFSVEMLAGRPVLRAHDSDHTPLLADLIGGKLRGEIDQRTAAAQTYQFLQNSGSLGIVNFEQVIDEDQWTVAGRFDSARPLFLFNASDDAATDVYISTQSGKVVQVTTARERFWNWFGSITHWIYSTWPIAS